MAKPRRDVWDVIKPVPFFDDPVEQLMEDRRARNLRVTLCSAPYRDRLARAYALFVQWLSRVFPLFAMDQVARSPEMVVELTCTYIQSLYKMEKTVTLASETILALPWRYRHLKVKLRGCWGVITSWKSELPQLQDSNATPDPLGAFQVLSTPRTDSWWSGRLPLEFLWHWAFGRILGSSQAL